MSLSPTNASLESLDRFYHIIQKPVISEKATDDTAKRNAYHFKVPIDANKVEIRQAIEAIFSVKVKSVNTLNRPGKKTKNRRTGTVGKKNDTKRAIVTLAGDDRISLFES